MSSCCGRKKKSLASKNKNIATTLFKFNEILKKRDNNTGTEYLVKNYRTAEERWLPGEHLEKVAPKRKERFDLDDEIRSKTRILDRYNQELSNRRPKNFGYDRGAELERVLGAMCLEGINVLEVKFKDHSESELVVWEAVKDNDPELLLEFYLEKTTEQLCYCK